MGDEWRERNRIAQLEFRKKEREILKKEEEEAGKKERRYYRYIRYNIKKLEYIILFFNRFYKV